MLILFTNNEIKNHLIYILIFVSQYWLIKQILNYILHNFKDNQEIFTSFNSH